MTRVKLSISEWFEGYIWDLHPITEKRSEFDPINGKREYKSPEAAKRAGLKWAEKHNFNVVCVKTPKKQAPQAS